MKLWLRLMLSMTLVAFSLVVFGCKGEKTDENADTNAQDGTVLEETGDVEDIKPMTEAERLISDFWFTYIREKGEEMNTAQTNGDADTYFSSDLTPWIKAEREKFENATISGDLAKKFVEEIEVQKEFAKDVIFDDEARTKFFEAMKPVEDVVRAKMDE